jgi:hypothetical protein
MDRMFIQVTFKKIALIALKKIQVKKMEVMMAVSQKQMMLQIKITL